MPIRNTDLFSTFFIEDCFCFVFDLFARTALIQAVPMTTSSSNNMADLLDGPLLDMPRNLSTPNLVSAPLQPAATALPPTTPGNTFDPFAGLSGSLSSQNLRATPSGGLPMNATASRSGSGTFARGAASVNSQNLIGILHILGDRYLFNDA